MIFSWMDWIMIFLVKLGGVIWLYGAVRDTAKAVWPRSKP